ncbi:MAG TPA: DUF4279 domain-containing protein [Sphingomicrobium sp.]|nr:DUF4279 domain-containing protein [Sphingomicrobium sp.]
MLTLAITGFEVDPARITKILEIEPTAVAHKGVVSLPSKREKTFNGWWREAHAARLSSGADHEKALSLIIDLLRGREERFARLREEVRPEAVGIYGGFYLAQDEQAGVWLDPAQMRVLADCKVEWGLDLFSAR